MPVSMADTWANWPEPGLRLEIERLWPGLVIELAEALDSTNSELMRRVHAGSLAPVLLVAQQQTAGRGRRGRLWQSTTDGGSLTFSLGLPLQLSDWSGLSLAVGLGVATGLDRRVRLKWPNDLWWQDRKLGGILVETASFGAQRYAVVGVGLNIAPRAVEGLRVPPAALQELLPGTDAAQALARLLPSLLRALRRFEQQGFSVFRQDYLARDVLMGREVNLSDGGSGRAAGVDERGALLVHTAQGAHAVHSAEVSVRPVT